MRGEMGLKPLIPAQEITGEHSDVERNHRIQKGKDEG
jgi:hypothetical protein